MAPIAVRAAGVPGGRGKVIMFPQWFVAGLVYGALVLTALGVTLLVVLLIQDLRKKKLW